MGRVDLSLDAAPLIPVNHAMREIAF